MAAELTLDQERGGLGRQGRGHSPTGLMLRALWRRRIARAAIIYILFFYAVALFAPLLAPYSYRQQNLGNVEKGPSLKHPFGTDRLGRDLFSRVIYATRTTAVLTIITASAGSLVLGPLLGLLAGYIGGWLDSAINRVGEVVASLPDLLIVILLAATIGPRLNAKVAEFYDIPYFGGLLKEGYASIMVVAVVLTFTSWVGGMRLIRALTLSVRGTDYVLAARAAGGGTMRILLAHILPNISYIIILGVAASFGAIALSEIGLSFLGLGVRPPTPSFGTMILEGFRARDIDRNPHLLLFPATFAVLLLLAFNLLADALNDVLNPKTREF